MTVEAERRGLAVETRSLPGLPLALSAALALLGGVPAAAAAQAEPEPAPRAGVEAVQPEAPAAEVEEPPAGAEAPEAREPERSRRSRIHRDTQVIVGSSLTIEAGESTRDAVVIGGSLRIDGEVSGDALAIGGSVHIEGEVTGDVVAVGGSVHLGSQARVDGDVVSVGGRVQTEPGAEIHGEVVEAAGPGVFFGPWWDWRWDHDFEPDFDLGHFPFGGWASFTWKLGATLVLALIACLVLLLARGPVERVEQRVAADPWKAALAGLLAEILFFPLLILVIVVLCISIVGIPLLILVPFAILAFVGLFVLGYTAVAYRLGRWAAGRFGWNVAGPFVALLLGILFVQGWSLVGKLLSLGGGPVWLVGVLLGLFGFLLKYIVWTIGLGATVLTRFGTASGWSRGAPVAAAVAQPPAPAASYESAQPVEGGPFDDPTGASGH